MSWQDYVDKSLVGTGKIDQAAIFDKTGTSVWACSPGFLVAPHEIKDILFAYDDKGDAVGIKKAQKDGINVQNIKYIVILCEGRSIYGRKGKEGIVIVRTKEAILVSHYPESSGSGEAAVIVEALADYLVSVGY